MAIERRHGEQCQMSKYSLSLQREEEIKTGERKSKTRILDWEVKNEKPSPNRVSYRLKLLNRNTKIIIKLITTKCMLLKALLHTLMSEPFPSFPI